MTENVYFKKFIFSKEQIEKYIQNALKDLKIAGENAIPEIKFAYSYNALLKMGITLIAKTKSLKVRSVPGHHIKIFGTMSKILNDDSVFTIGNAMRMKRNLDLYEGGTFISEKESKDYYNFVADVSDKVKNILKK